MFAMVNLGARKESQIALMTYESRCACADLSFILHNPLPACSTYCNTCLRSMYQCAIVA